MSKPQSSRRDARYALAQAGSRIEFDHPLDGRPCHARLTMIGIAGVGFEADPPIAGIAPGTLLSNACLRTGNRVVRGDVLVRNVSRNKSETLGGLFYPASHEFEYKLIRIVAGLARSRPLPGPDTTHVRCRKCHDSVPIVLRDGRRIQASCATCRQPYELSPLGTATSTAELFARARRLALNHEIDMPGANSVLFGLMDVEQVRALQGPPTGELTLTGEPTATADAQPRRARYDPAFRAAVEQGLLTPSQAFERGKREAWAAKLAEKHDLSKEIALSVADNRISLLNAIREQQGPAPPASIGIRPHPPSGSSGSSGAKIRVAAGIALLVVLGVGLRLSSATTGEKAHPISVLTREGRVVRIDGPDPRSVLEAYCKSGGPERELEVVGVRNSDRRPDLKVGILRDRAAPDERLAIYISGDRSRKRWSAGNGRSPLDAFQAPAERPTETD